MSGDFMRDLGSNSRLGDVSRVDRQMLDARREFPEAQRRRLYVDSALLNALDAAGVSADLIRVLRDALQQRDGMEVEVVEGAHGGADKGAADSGASRQPCSDAAHRVVIAGRALACLV